MCPSIVVGAFQRAECDRHSEQRVSHRRHRLASPAKQRSTNPSAISLIETFVFLYKMTIAGGAESSHVRIRLPSDPGPQRARDLGIHERAHRHEWCAANLAEHHCRLASNRPEKRPVSASDGLAAFVEQLQLFRSRVSLPITWCQTGKRSNSGAELECFVDA